MQFNEKIDIFLREIKKSMNLSRYRIFIMYYMIKYFAINECKRINI